MRTGLFLLFFAPFLIAQTPPAALDGDVVNSVTGAPIPSARVKLVAGRSEPRYTAANPAGHFHFDNVPAGTYTVQVEHPAYLPVSAISIRPGQTAVKVSMTAGAIVYGSVIDPNGLPASTGGAYMAQVFQLRPQDAHLSLPVLPDGKSQLVDVAISMIDDHGQYRSKLLGPGTYYVGIVANPSPGFWDRTARSTYYPHSLDLASAKRLDLAAGQEVRADVQVIRAEGVKVSGRLTVPSYETVPDTNVSTWALFISRSGLLGRPSGNATIRDGRFEATGLLPGKYDLVAVTSRSSADGAGRQLTYLSGSKREVEIGDRDLSDLDLQLEPLLPVSGKVTFDEGCPSASVPVHLSSSSFQGVLQYSTVSGPDGSFAFGSYPPGVISVTAAGPGAVSVFLGNRELPDRVFNYPLSTPEPLRMVIHCATGGAR